MEPKVKIDHGRELDELTKFTKKFFDDLQEYNKDKENTPNEAHIMVLACDSIGGASFLIGDPDKLSSELLTLVTKSKAFEEFLKVLIYKVQLIISTSNEKKSTVD
jgi:hypothetical protein